MKTIAFAAVLVVVLAPAVGAASAGESSPPDARADSLRTQGLDAGYNLDYAEALDAFRAAIALDRDDGTAHRLAAATIWMSLLFQQGAVTVEDYLGQARARHDRPAAARDLTDAFHEHLARARAIADEAVRRNPDDADARFQRGAVDSLHASFVATVEGRVLDSLGPARRAYSEHRRVLAIDPARTDAGLTVGTYEYAVASLSLPLRLLARLAGFRSGRERGLRLVEAAARHSGPERTKAQFMLVLMYNREGRHEAALEVLRALQARYPRNRLLWLEIGSTALRAGRPADALAALDTGLERLRADPRPRARAEEDRWHRQRAAALEALARHDRQRAIDYSFRSDTRNLVIAWNPNDPRPRDAREAALRAFVYQTYDTSAWIPHALFEGNLARQLIAGDIQTIVREKVGLVPWRENSLVPAYGMAPSRDGPLRWTVNCLVCHTAEIDGVAYFGAGTKVFDDRWLGEALKTMTGPRWRPILVRDEDAGAVAANAHRILNSHHHEKIDSLTRARSTAFAASHVELYMRPNGGAMPAPADVGRGDVKTPPLWHTAAKIPVRRWYSDGSFHGRYPLMASSMELEKDRPFDALVTRVIPAIKQEFDDVIRHLRPPRYPYSIDAAAAERGRQLFYSAEIGCSRCHGRYDADGTVYWPGLHIDVGTDRSRLDVVSDKFIDAFDDSPLAAEGALRKSRGYAATPLTGVWANYPYLHNGSVPTLYHLLGPASERPRIFHVKAAARFDRVRVGQLLYLESAHGRAGELTLLRRFGSDRDWFDTSRAGSGSGGHDYWARIRTDENRRALIEYLKTL
jgi:tetratricopeptide (TPR) repeat protein